MKMRMIKQFKVIRSRELLVLLLTACLISCGNSNTSSDLYKQKDVSDTVAVPVVQNFSIETDTPSPGIEIDVADPENDLCSVTFKFYYPDDEEAPTETSSVGVLDKEYNNDTDLFELGFSFNMGFWERWRMDIILIDQEGNSTTIEDIYFTKTDIEENQNWGTSSLLSNTIETDYTYQQSNETSTLGTQYATSGNQTIPGTIIIMAH